MTEILPIKEGSNEETKEFLRRLVELLLDFIVQSNDRSNKVLEFQQPHELVNKFDFVIPEDPQNLQTIIDDCQRTLVNQVRTGKCRRLCMLKLPFSNLIRKVARKFMLASYRQFETTIHASRIVFHTFASSKLELLRFFKSVGFFIWTRRCKQNKFVESFKLGTIFVHN